MLHDVVKDYYGNTLEGSCDLKTDACSTLEMPTREIRGALSNIRYDKPNTRFLEGYLEKLDDLDLEKGSFDLIISNCVFNLCVDKPAVFKSAFDLLKDGGEVYFSDVYSDRRIPDHLVDDEVLYGECLSGALYWVLRRRREAMMMFKRFGFIGLAVLVTACSAPEAIYVSGSSTVLPPVSKAAEMFTADTGIPVIVNAGGSGGGFNQLAEGQTDIAMMSRNITNGERESFKGTNFTEIAIGRDAVVPSISSEIYDAGVTALTLSQIGGIYTGDINNWSEVGGPDRDIFAIDKEASRGTRQVFMNVVLGNPMAEAPGADLVTGSNN